MPSRPNLLPGAEREQQMVEIVLELDPLLLHVFRVKSETGMSLLSRSSTFPVSRWYVVSNLANCALDVLRMSMASRMSGNSA